MAGDVWLGKSGRGEKTGQDRTDDDVDTPGVVCMLLHTEPIA
jgi:hypothetical protein